MTETNSFAGDPSTIVAVTCVLLGIHPHRSLVVVAFTAEGQVLVTLRHDITTDPAMQTEQGAHLAVLLSRNSAAAAVVLTFDVDRMTAYGHRAATEAALRAAGIRVVHSLHVDAEQIIDAAGECWPRPTEEQTEQIRRQVGAEKPVNREEKINAVAPVEAFGVTQEVAWADVETADPGTAATDLDALCGLYLATGQISDREIARYAIASGQVRYRDALCVAVAARDAMPNTAQTLVYLAQRVPPGYRSDAYAAAGLALYLGGKTIEARGALGQALAADPEHTLTRLITASLDGGIPPKALREMVASLTDDL